MKKIADSLFWMDSIIKMPLVQLGVRMTGIRLKDDSVVLVSPIKFSDEQKKQIDSFGRVSAIVAPNCFHHLYLSHALKAYPGAKLIGVTGLEKKRSNLRFDHIISNNVVPENWSGTLSQTLVGGMPGMNEAVFVHHPTRTLVVTDLIFNITELNSIKEHVFWKLNRAYKKPACSNIFRFMMRDKRLVRQSVEYILRWDFDRIIMAHGTVIETGGKKLMEEVFTWLLKR